MTWTSNCNFMYIFCHENYLCTIFCRKYNQRTLFCCKNDSSTLVLLQKQFTHTFLSQKLFTHFFLSQKRIYAPFLTQKRFTRFFVAKTIYALRPESFCALKVAIRKVQTFWASATKTSRKALRSLMKTSLRALRSFWRFAGLLAQGATSIVFPGRWLRRFSNWRGSHLSYMDPVTICLLDL